MTEPDRDPCANCQALILRDGRWPDCERAALYGQPGCLRARYRPEPGDDQGKPFSRRRENGRRKR